MKIAVVLALPLMAYAAPPDFAHDVAPIVYKYCAPCHRPGESGPFSLLSYADVKQRARMIAEVTASRYMPPWPPEAGYGEFSDDLRLSDAQIRTIAGWAAAGAPEGVGTPAPPQFTEGWQLGPPDLIVEARKAYSLAASGPEVYWNFIFSPDLKTTRYVRAVEIRPGNKRIVHHANLYIDRARSARRQEIAPGAGFPGMDPVIERTAFEPDDGHFLFWKPGGVATPEPDGLAWRLDPGNDLLLNTHMRPSGKPEQVRPVIGLYFTDKPQDRFPMLIQIEHDGALQIPPGVRDFVISDDFRLPLDVDVLAVYPHAHYLARVMEGYATLPSGERKWLLRIPDWDPAWQGTYNYRQPVFLPKGAVLSMRFHYDNSSANPRNPNQPPKRVVAGNHATDEMGHLWFQVLPRGGDHRRELQEALMRHRLEKYPDDFGARLQLGGVMLSRLNPSGAAAILQEAVRLDPKHPEVHNLLGSAYSALGRNTEAIEQFRLALTLRPDYENARLNLGRAMLKAGKVDEAIEDCSKVIAVFPEDPAAKDCLAKASAARK